MKDALAYCLHDKCRDCPSTPRLLRELDDKEDIEPMYEQECHK